MAESVIKVEADKSVLDGVKYASRVLDFVTPSDGTLTIREAVCYGRFIMFPFVFAANTSISAWTALATINNSIFRPVSDLNLYLVADINGTLRMVTMQVLANGNIRCSQALGNGDRLTVELFWISKVLD